MILRRINKFRFLAFFIMMFIASSIYSESSYYDLNKMNRKDLANLEQELNNKINDSLKTYLGKDFRYSAFVQLIARSIPDNNDAQINKNVDIGYLYVPGVQDISPQIDNFKLSSARVSLFLYDKLKNNILNNVKSLIRAVMPKLRMSVKFNMYTDPPIEIPTVLPKPKEIILPKTWKDHVIDNMPAFLTFLGTILTAFIILASFGILGATVKSSVAAIANSIQSAKLHLKEEQAISPEDKKNEGKDELTESIDIPTRNFKEEINGYVEIINNTINNNPHSFALTSSAATSTDLQGLKSLMPSLAISSNEALSESLNDDLLTKIYNEKSKSKLTILEYTDWLKDFSERITINSLRQNSYFCTFLDEAYVKAFQNEDPFLLAQIAERSNSKMPVKIVLDFISGDARRNLVKKFTMKDWKEIIEEKIPSAGTINKMAESMINAIQFMKNNPNENNEQHLDKVIMPSIIDLMSAKNMSEGEVFMEQISKISPDFAKSIKEQVWTAGTLLDIPTSYLTSQISSLASDDRMLLLIGMPNNVFSYLKKIIPESKSKLILMDQINRFKASPNDTKRSEARLFCSTFLDKLKQDERRGLFSLIKNNVHKLDRQSPTRKTKKDAA